MKKPEATWYSRKEANKIVPFDDISSVEFYSSKSDSSLFMMGTHTKKRPNNLIIGRMFDHQLLDMVEFCVSEFKAMKEFNKGSEAIGSKPMFVLAGEAFQTESAYKVVANLFVDFFRGRVVEKINIQGLDHLILLSVNAGVIHFSHYAVKLKKSGTQVPKIDLVEVGPSMDLTLRRTKLASDDLRKETLRIHPSLLPHSKGNVKTNAMNDKVGQLYLPRQDIGQIVTKKPRGLKRHLSADEHSDDAAPSASKKAKH